MPQRAFPLLVLLPKRDLEDAPPFIHLGTQFLLEYKAALHLDCSATDQPGKLIIP
jgi:hypothetical protein